MHFPQAEWICMVAEFAFFVAEEEQVLIPVHPCAYLLVDVIMSWSSVMVIDASSSNVLVARP